MTSLQRKTARSHSPRANSATSTRRPPYARALPAAVLLCAALIGGALLFGISARAAVVIEYFNAIPSASAVLLEWSTTSEYNVAGFNVLAKGVDDPRSAYTRLAFLNAKGGPDQGAAYDLLVNNLQAGKAYCFRLEEVTTDETPGEARERCGYGLGIGPTPEPSPTATLSQTFPLTPTVVLFPTTAGGANGFEPTATFVSGFPTSTPDPNQPISPLPGQTGPEAWTPTWTPDPLLQGGQPTPFDAAAYNATLEAAALQQPTLDPLIYGTPTPDPFAQAQPPTLDPFAQAQPPFDSALALPTPMPMQLVPTATIPVAAPAPGDGAQPLPGDGSLVGDATPTPTSLYVVVTAAPTPLGIAAGPTPWPTVTPPAGSTLAGLLVPTAQNLTVLLLCFIFLSATGLGVLGLLTSIVYMRARAQREQDDLRARARRRLL